MEWLQLAIVGEREDKQRISAKPIKPEHFAKFTQYDHNQTSSINIEQMKFTCLFNCKRINRHFSTICMVQGDLRYGIITVTCALLNQLMVVGGRWNCERTQLIRFAAKYNERSSNQANPNNISVKVDPSNGQVNVSQDFWISPVISSDHQKLKKIITSYCQSIGWESEKIFNTVTEIIYCKEADQPYLKSKPNASLPPRTKIEKLLDKVKPLISTSCWYEIKKDISGPNKERSYFKKNHLNKTKVINHSRTYQYARAYEPKFHPKYEMEEIQSKFPRLRDPHFIKRYSQIEEKYQTQFAKHLNQKNVKQNGNETSKGLPYKFCAFKKANFSDRIFLSTSSQQEQAFCCQEVDPELLAHESDTINKYLKYKHPNMVQYFKITGESLQIKSHRITEPKTMPLDQYLKRNKETLWLTTKLKIVTQICHFIQYIHSCTGSNPNKILFPIKMENLVMAQEFTVKFKDFTRVIVPSDKTQSQNVTNRLNNREFPFINLSDKGARNDKSHLDPDKGDVFSLGMVIYRILMQKFPFFEEIERMNHQSISNKQWQNLWLVQTESFVQYGGQIVKLIANLLLRCLYMEQQDSLSEEKQSNLNPQQKLAVKIRPYVQWLTVIMFQTHHSLEGIF